MNPVMAPAAEVPAERQQYLRQAIHLEIWTLLYLVSLTSLMYVTMGNSQAMKTVWIEDLLNFIPPIAFLVSTYLRTKPPNSNFPYGYHRISTIAFLIASVAIIAMGCYLLIDALIDLIHRDRPSIGTVVLFGTPIWLGWLMFPVLLWDIVPAFFLGRMMIGPARKLHDKTLYANGVMCKASWLSGAAGVVGVAGIAIGWWWADAVAAAVISVDILHDGWHYTRVAITDLMDRAPRTVDDRSLESLPARLVTKLKQLDWVQEAQVRLREHGHVFFGEAFLTPKDRRNLIARTQQALETAYHLDWRLQELVVQFVSDPVERTAQGTSALDESEDSLQETAQHRHTAMQSNRSEAG